MGGAGDVGGALADYLGEVDVCFADATLVLVVGGEVLV